MFHWAECDWGYSEAWTGWGKGLVAYCARNNNEYPAYDPSDYNHYVPYPMENRLTAGPFDLSGANKATLGWEAWCWLNPGDWYTDDTYKTADEFKVGYSTDGVNYTTTEYGASMVLKGWADFSQDLSPVAGKSAVWIGFFYHADQGSIREQGAYVNNVTLTKEIVAAPAPVVPASAELPKVYLSKPNAPRTMYKGKARTISGYLKPRHTKGTYPVRIYKYRYVSGKWKSYGYVKAKASNYSTYTKYSKTFSLPSKGKWRLRAVAPVDSLHAKTYSRYDYVTVK